MRAFKELRRLGKMPLDVKHSGGYASWNPEKDEGFKRYSRLRNTLMSLFPRKFKRINAANSL